MTRARFKKAWKRLLHARRALQIVWAAAGAWTFAWLVILVLQGIVPTGVVYMTKWVVDAVAAVIGQGATWAQVDRLLLPVGLMGILMLAQRVLPRVNQYVSTAQSELVSDHLKERIHAKAASVDYSFYESDQYYDLLEQANSQASNRTLNLLQNIGSVISSSVTFVTIGGLLLRYSLWLPLILLVSAAPAFVILVRYNRKHHNWWNQSTPERRRAQYYDVMLTQQMAAAEIRINDLGEYFKRRYQHIRERLRNERLGILRQQAVAGTVAGLIALLATGGVMGWIVWRAMQGLATIGDLALFYQAFNQGQGIVRTLLNNVGQIYTNTLFLEHLFAFLEQPRRVQDPDEPRAFPKRVSEGVAFENVTFSYPGFEKSVLRDFSLHLPAGKVTAIVGENGSGKSTLVKLLCRFYDPQQGQVLIDDVDVRQFRQADLRRQLSVMFQFPMKYQFTAEQNIALGDLERVDRADVETAARGAGAHDFISRLPEGYDTLLGRWFEHGTELSGGEWQRIALARAYFRQAQILVLDEPTSSMDSWSENEWLTRFKRLAEGQTTLIITHRFTTAMQADVIHVMDKGEIIESGAHEELLAQDGRYAQSWKAQMRQEHGPATV